MCTHSRAHNNNNNNNNNNHNHNNNNARERLYADVVGARKIVYTELMAVIYKTELGKKGRGTRPRARRALIYLRYNASVSSSYYGIAQL